MKRFKQTIIIIAFIFILLLIGCLAYHEPSSVFNNIP